MARSAIREQKRLERHFEKRGEIRAGAIALLEKGLGSFTIKKLAKAISVSKPVIYYYYEDEDDLLVDIARNFLICLQEHVAYTVKCWPSMPARGVRKGIFDAYALNPVMFDVLYVIIPSRGLYPRLAEYDEWKNWATFRMKTIEELGLPDVVATDSAFNIITGVFASNPNRTEAIERCRIHTL